MVIIELYPLKFILTDFLLMVQRFFLLTIGVETFSRRFFSTDFGVMGVKHIVVLSFDEVSCWILTCWRKFQAYMSRFELSKSQAESGKEQTT